MWPLDRKPAHECLRIGRVSAERWSGHGASLVLKTSVRLPDQALAARESLVPLFSELFAEPPQGAVGVALESACLPLLLADTGGALLRMSEAQALIRHRLASYHAERPGDDLAAWDVRLDFRAGDRFAFGYGLSPRIKQVLLGAAQSVGVTLAELTPAFVWGWHELRCPIGDGWWVWPEQDRLLLARFHAGHLVAFNPAAPLVDGGAAIEGLVQAEVARCGGEGADDRVVVSSWRPPVQLPAPSQRLMWRSLAGAL